MIAPRTIALYGPAARGGRARAGCSDSARRTAPRRIDRGRELGGHRAGRVRHVGRPAQRDVAEEREQLLQAELRGGRRRPGDRPRRPAGRRRRAPGRAGSADVRVDAEAVAAWARTRACARRLCASGRGCAARAPARPWRSVATGVGEAKADRRVRPDAACRLRRRQHHRGAAGRKPGDDGRRRQALPARARRRRRPPSPPSPSFDRERRVRDRSRQAEGPSAAGRRSPERPARGGRSRPAPALPGSTRSQRASSRAVGAVSSSRVRLRASGDPADPAGTAEDRLGDEAGAGRDRTAAAGRFRPRAG